MSVIAWLIVIIIIALIVFMLFSLFTSREFRFYTKENVDEFCVRDGRQEFCSTPIYSDSKLTSQIGAIDGVSYPGVGDYSDRFNGSGTIWLNGKPYLPVEWTVTGSGVNREWTFFPSDKTTAYYKGKAVVKENVIEFVFYA